MSYPEFSSFAVQQDVTLAPADLTFFDHQVEYPVMQSNIDNYRSQPSVDLAPDLGNMLGANFTTWNWFNSPLLSPPSLQQNYSEIQAVPTAFTSTANTTPLLNPMAQPFEHGTPIYQEGMQGSWISSDFQAPLEEPQAIDKFEELMSIFADFQAKTEQRMTLIEKEIREVKSRLEDDTARFCEEVEDAVSRLQVWTGQVREAVDGVRYQS
ncbi:hypothetical protein CC86DRAFT_414223 [Ophiobolus disseminans]|uniref:Uncharacterized protein n=1 Tax=Ophiobolus disseminans TaxID=1469910 RepID=A0A6A6ZB54_9PLEO|nr:hypothetical protein CC86DRAFT_414223 [Ophiobolus disseminans]